MKIQPIYFLLILMLITKVFQAKDINNLPPQNKSISFTENKGQFADQNYKPRPDILFGGSDGQLTFHITKSGISYQQYRVDSYKETENPKTKEKRKIIDQQTIYRTDIKWVNANLNPLVITDETLPGYNNYYLEQCPNGALEVKSFKGITLQNIYNNIDLHYYEKEGHLKYDYIVAPHADYKKIKLQMEGAVLKLQNDGSLIIKTPLGKIQEQAPIVYQNGKQLKAYYKINDDHISFEVEKYDSNYELIIDPVTRLWGTYYGGMVDEYGLFSTTDASGNVYMTGMTYSNANTVIATSGSHQNTFGGGGTSDAFLVQFNSSGSRQWGTYYGGTGGERGHSCAIDANGNVYMSGETESTVGTVIATGGSHQSSHGGTSGLDAFLVKFNIYGIRQWSTYYGGAGDDVGRGCACDAMGNVYVTGRTSSNTGTVIATAVSHQGLYGGGLFNGFLVKFNNMGIRLWGTYYGDTGNDEGFSCTTDVSGNVYMSGAAASYTGTAIATSGSHQSIHGGNYSSDAFLVKFNNNGLRMWGTYYGGVGDEYGASCTIDVFGDVYMTGSTTTTTNLVIASLGSHQTIHGGGGSLYDAFLVKFSNNGILNWGTYYGGTGQDYAFSCTTDAVGNVYIAGITTSNTGTVIASNGSYQSVSSLGGDAFLAKFNSTGIRQWGTYYGGTGAFDDGYSCSTDNFSNVYLVGCSDTNFGNQIATVGSHQSANGGQLDAYIVKFSDCQTPSQLSNIFGPTSTCLGTLYSYSVNIDTLANYYTWNLPAGWSGTSLTNTISTTAGSTGVFTVTASNICGVSPQQTIQVTVNPTPTITVNSGSICSGESFIILPLGANSYTISGGNFTVAPTNSKSYTVVGTGTMGCIGQATSTVSVNKCTYLKENIGHIHEIQVYPNPNNGIFTIDATDEIKLSVIDVLGKTIFSKQISEGNTIIDLSIYPDGLYLLKSEGKDSVKNIRLIKQ